ncbi:MAG: hypothetical protein H7195_09705 [Chryseobacterium sp.]|nr:hypothetical protein [Chryseobacterium sp.]
MIEQFINAFKEIENPTFSSVHDLKVWQGKAKNIIVRSYGENSIQEKQIKEINFKSYADYSNNLKSCSKKHASELIGGFISDLEKFGMPIKREKKHSEGIQISINQNQTQTINLNIIFDALKEELTRKQIKELEEVINSDNKLENKKTNLINKLKSFGSDILTNVIANILTNPGLLGG